MTHNNENNTAMTLSSDVLLLVLQYCSATELCSARRVSKQFSTVLENAHCWQFAHYGPIDIRYLSTIPLSSLRQLQSIELDGPTDSVSTQTIVTTLSTHLRSLTALRRVHLPYLRPSLYLVSCLPPFSQLTVLSMSQWPYSPDIGTYIQISNTIRELKLSLNPQNNSQVNEEFCDKLSKCSSLQTLHIGVSKPQMTTPFQYCRTLTDLSIHYTNLRASDEADAQIALLADSLPLLQRFSVRVTASVNLPSTCLVSCSRMHQLRYLSLSRLDCLSPSSPSFSFSSLSHLSEFEYHHDTQQHIEPTFLKQLSTAIACNKLSIQIPKADAKNQNLFPSIVEWFPALQALELSGSLIPSSATHFTHIAQLKHLQTFSAFDFYSAATDEHFRLICTSLPTLTSLTFPFNDELSVGGIELLARLPLLSHLDFRGRRLVSHYNEHSKFDILIQLRQLRTLNVENNPFFVIRTAEELRQLASHLTKLHTLQIPFVFSSRFTDSERVSQLVDWKSLCYCTHTEPRWTSLQNIYAMRNKQKHNNVNNIENME